MAVAVLRHGVAGTKSQPGTIRSIRSKWVALMPVSTTATVTPAPSLFFQAAVASMS